MNGCDFVLHIGQTTEGEHTYGVTTDLVCPPGNSIEMTAGEDACSVTFPPQTGLTGPHLTQTTGTEPHDIDLVGTFTNLKAVACHFLSTEQAQFHTDLTIEGHNEAGGPTGVTITH